MKASRAYLMAAKALERRPEDDLSVNAGRYEVLYNNPRVVFDLHSKMCEFYQHGDDLGDHEYFLGLGSLALYFMAAIAEWDEKHKRNRHGKR